MWVSYTTGLWLLIALYFSDFFFAKASA